MSLPSVLCLNKQALTVCQAHRLALQENEYGPDRVPALHYSHSTRGRGHCQHFFFFFALHIPLFPRYFPCWAI